MANAENQEGQNKNQAPVDPDKAYSQYIDPDFKEKQKKKKLLIIVGAITAVLAILGVVAAVVFFASSDSSGNVPQQATETVKDCEDELCFEEQFSLCQMSTYEGQGPEEDSKAEYKIPGIVNIGCLVTVKYLESADAEIVGKEMTCDFDNELGFREALELVNEYPEDYECEGSLIDFYNELTEEAELLYGI
ncbi:MAG: hypothetical protein WD885_03145 [Candidatus Saccharimonadales bacterium]